MAAMEGSDVADAVGDMKISESGDAPKTFDWMPQGMKPMADGEYDVIVMGTGFTECLLSGLLCTIGMKVLVVDRNNYYGGESASLNLTNLYKKMNNGATPPPEFFAGLGNAKDRDFNIDLIPKFIMAHGNLVKILLHTKVTRYLDFKSIDGSFVVKGGKVHKVPATPKEALASSLMGMFEKRRFRNFLIYMNDYNPEDPSTHKGYDLNKMTAADLYYEYGLDAYTQEFIGHTMALFVSEEYRNRPAIELITALQLYSMSLQSYGSSPYIYPLYGLGGLPESFSRLAAIHGGTFMLNRSVDEILFDKDGCAWGIRGDDEVAKGTMFIGDPSYFPKEKVKATGKVVRSLCICTSLPPNLGDAMSAQIIIPGPQVNKTSDIYVMCLSKDLEVCAGNVVICIVSTKVDNLNSADPISELNPGIALLGTIKERFDTVQDSYEPVDSGLSDRCFISKTYDDSSHFKSAAEDVLDMYERVTGTPLDMSIDTKIPQPGDY
jgi:Rab GDP dissociation inhibitor